MASALLIETDAHSAFSLKAMLEALGFCAEIRDQCPLEALPSDALSGYRLLMLDLALSSATGLECISSLRRAHPDLAILAMSAQMNPGHLKAARALGAAGALQKPFHLAELRRELQRMGLVPGDAASAPTP